MDIRTIDRVNQIRKTTGLQAVELPNVMFRNICVPTLDINPRYASFSKTAGSVTTGNAAIYTTPLDKDTYITSITVGYIKDATCDTATSISNGVFTVIDGLTTYIVPVPCLTLTAQSYNFNVVFPYPMKIDRGVAVVFSGSYTAGSCARVANITGFWI